MNTIKKEARSIFIFILIIILMVVTMHFFVIPVHVDGNSMANNIHNGDYMLMNGHFKKEDLKRFDILVINSNQADEILIKRLIGLPGETIKFENDQLYINGEYIDEKFLDIEFMEEQKKALNSKLFTENFEVTLGDNEYFAMGDNRLSSSDSRVYGSFHLSEIRSRRGVVIFPLSHFKKV